MPTPNLNPGQGNLDQTQILQRAFDETKDRLRTDGTFTGTIEAEVSVEIDAADGDNIALASGDGSKIVDVTANNELATSDDETHTKLDTGNASLASIDGKLTAPLAVTGPLTDAELRATAIPISAATLPLPTGAATSALQTQPGVDIGDVTINNAAGASAVNIQDGGNSITVDGTVAISGAVAVTGPLTDVQLRATPVPVSGTVTANAGAGTFAVSAATLPLPADAATETTLAKLPLTQGSTTSGQSGTLAQGAVTTAAPAYTTAKTSPLSLTPVGNLRVDGSTVTQPIREVQAITATLSNIAASATNVTLLASNASRRGVIIYNDSTKILYVKFGATASATSFTIKMGSDGFYEMHTPVYTGIIDGIWASASGTARITELT